jgi:PhzF family phenazine biosynthesis protein
VEFLGAIGGEERKVLLEALGLDDTDIHDRCPIEIISTGHSKVMICLKCNDRLQGLHPNLDGLSRLSQQLGCDGYFDFTLDSSDAQILTHGRMFAPAIGIIEDPVTGTAHGPLGAYLVHHGLVEHDGQRYTFHGQQGDAMHRPGKVHVDVSMRDGKPVSVKVSGHAVIVFETTLTL